MRKLNSLFAVLALSGIAVSAQAQVTMTTANRISGGYGINLTINSVNKSTSYTGPFATTAVGPGFVYSNFDSYCVDLADNLQATETITIKDIKTALPTSGAQVAYLYDTFAGGVGTDAVKGAALQIAIWEVEYDYGTNGIDLNHGLFTFNSVAGDPTGHPNYTSIVNQANSYLSAVPSSFSGTAKFLDASQMATPGQSLIGPANIGTANVPEPGAVSLLASSLIGMSAFAIRRRRK